MIGQKTYPEYTFSVCDIPIWKDDFAEREPIMAIDASHPYVPAIGETYKKVVRVVEQMGC